MNWTIKTFDELTSKEIYEILRSRAEVFVKEQKISYVDPDGVDYRCLRPAYNYAWESVYQGWLADKAGVFEPVCYDEYSCGAGGEIVQNVVRTT